MPGILEHLGKINNHVKILQTARQNLDSLDEDNLNYDDKEQVRDRGQIIEPNRGKCEKGIPLSMSEIHEAPEPIFRHFLDGSRRTYKIADLSWDKGFYPLIAGQIVVACCHRPDARTFRQEKLARMSVLSVPEVFDAHGRGANYYLYARKKLNESILADESLQHIQCKVDMKIGDILKYKIDGRKDGADRRNDFLNRAIAAIQGTMTDLEQETVKALCDEGKLNDDNWLIKDGSLEYNPSYSYGREYSFELPQDVSSPEFYRIMRHRRSFRYVLGASKLFDPDLLNDISGRPMSHALANLQPYHRTYAYKYYSTQSNADFIVWYVRLRDSEKSRSRKNLFSDILKCELLFRRDVTSEDIDRLSIQLVREAHPTCYGADSRWGNHLYPIFLTESYCKSCYMSNESFLNLF